MRRVNIWPGAPSGSRCCGQGPVYEQSSQPESAISQNGSRSGMWGYCSTAGMEILHIISLLTMKVI